MSVLIVYLLQLMTETVGSMQSENKRVNKHTALNNRRCGNGFKISRKHIGIIVYFMLLFGSAAALIVKYHQTIN